MRGSGRSQAQNERAAIHPSLLRTHRLSTQFPSLQCPRVLVHSGHRRCVPNAETSCRWDGAPATVIDHQPWTYSVVLYLKQVQNAKSKVNVSG